MNDLISRQAVIEINRSYHGQMPNEVNHRIWKEINELPSAQPEKVDTPTVDTPNCDDTISRQAAIEIVDFECGEWRGLAKTITKRLSGLPPAQPQRKKGKWIDETFKPWGLVHHPYKCDQCGEHSETDSDFCPNCGADMREPEDIPMEYFESGGR